MAVGATRWLAWLSLGFGFSFVVLSVASTVASSNLELFHHQRRAHGRA
jgi:hypothetical protein